MGAEGHDAGVVVRHDQRLLGHPERLQHPVAVAGVEVDQAAAQTPGEKKQVREKSE